MKWSFLGTLPILLLLASCSLFETDSSCDPALGDGDANYVPLAVGDVWTFDYEEGAYSTSGSERVIGTLRWAVTDEGACRGGRQVFTIQETFEGAHQVLPPGPTDWQTTEPRSWTEQRSFTRNDETIDLDIYAFEPLPYVYDAATPDTVVVGQAGTRGEDAACAAGSSGGPCSERIALVRDQGLVSRSVTDQISVGTVGRVRLERRD